MNPSVQVTLAIITSALASSGLWAFITRLLDKKSKSSKMLLGLAHDRILYLGSEYLKRDPKYITMQEYENLHDYLYIPYEALGGNGSAKRIMNEIEKLPVCYKPEGDDTNE